MDTRLTILIGLIILGAYIIQAINSLRDTINARFKRIHERLDQIERGVYDAREAVTNKVDQTRGHTYTQIEALRADLGIGSDRFWDKR